MSKEIIKILRLSPDGLRLRMLAWRMRADPLQVLDELHLMASRKQVESVSYSEPANMEYWIQWKLTDEFLKKMLDIKNK